MTRLPVSFPKLTPKTFLTAAKAAGKYSGLTQMGIDAVEGVKHPIRRLKGEDAPIVMLNGKPVRMFSGEVPASPGKALTGALARAEQKGVSKEMLQSMQDARHVVGQDGGHLQFIDAATGKALAPGQLANAFKNIQHRYDSFSTPKGGRPSDKLHPVNDPSPYGNHAEEHDVFSYRFPGLIEGKGGALVATNRHMHHDNLRQARPNSTQYLSRGFVNSKGLENFDMELHMYDTSPDGFTPGRIMAGLYNGSKATTQGTSGSTQTSPARMRGLTRTLHELSKEGIRVAAPKYESPPLLAKVAKQARGEGIKSASLNRQERAAAAHSAASSDDRHEKAVGAIMGAIRDNPRLPRSESEGAWARRMSQQAKLPSSQDLAAEWAKNGSSGMQIGRPHPPNKPRPPMGSSTQRALDKIKADLGLKSTGASGYRGRN